VTFTSGPTIEQAADAGGDAAPDGPNGDEEGADSAVGMGPKRVFITAQIWLGDLGVDGGGVNAADKHCTDAAKSYLDGGTFRAWLETSAEPNGARVQDVAGGWLLAGTSSLVATDKASLLSKGPLVAIDRAETGDSYPSYLVWTGAVQTCADWSTPVAGVMGTYGSAVASPTRWRNDGLQLCAQNGHLYCFEQ
jgi:hypothetical protein